MTWAAVAVAAGTAISAGTQAGMGASAKSSSNAAAKRAAEMQQHYMENAMRASDTGTGRAMRQLKPYSEAGTQALPYYQQAAQAPAYGVDQFNRENGTNLSMSGMLDSYGPGDYQAEWGQDPRQYLQQGNFQASPDYAWRKQQGMEGIQQSAAGRGSLLSGATLKALNNYNSNLASAEFGNWFNRDMQNRQLGLGNFWQANQGNRQDRNMQLDALNSGAARNQMRTNNLGQLVGIGQQAAGQRAQYAYGNGRTLADLLSGGGDTQAGLAMQQGMNNAQGAANMNNAIQGGLSNALLMYGMYGGKNGGGDGSSGGMNNNALSSAMGTGGSTDGWANGSNMFASLRKKGD